MNFHFLLHFYTFPKRMNDLIFIIFKFLNWLLIVLLNIFKRCMIISALINITESIFVIDNNLCNRLKEILDYLYLLLMFYLLVFIHQISNWFCIGISFFTNYFKNYVSITFFYIFLVFFYIFSKFEYFHSEYLIMLKRDNNCRLSRLSIFLFFSIIIT